jgi:hypothetical protein
VDPTPKGGTGPSEPPVLRRSLSDATSRANSCQGPDRLIAGSSMWTTSPGPQRTGQILRRLRRRPPRPADARLPGHTRRPRAAASARRRPPEASRRRRRSWRHAVGRLERGRGTRTTRAAWRSRRGCPSAARQGSSRGRAPRHRRLPRPAEHVGEVPSRDELEAPVAKFLVRGDRLRAPPTRLLQATGDSLHLTLPGPRELAHHDGNVVGGAVGDGPPWRRSREVGSWGASPHPRGTRHP